MSVRQIVLDTETTGLDVRLGHRIIEIGAIEVVNRRLTGHRFHRYLNPDREIDPGAIEVHGITNEFVADKPRFGDVVDELLDFLSGAEVLIHNARFDTGFLNQELTLLSREPIETSCTVSDTLALARELHPGQQNNLDALCRRYGVDNSGRQVHGALLDATLLAEVWLAMTRGQDSLAIEPMHMDAAIHARTKVLRAVRVLRASPEECAAHRRVLEEIVSEAKGLCLWQEAVSETAPPAVS